MVKKVLGIGIGIAIVAVIAIFAISQTKAQSSAIDSSKQVSINQATNPSTTNLQYTVTKVSVSKSWPNTGLAEKPEGQYMLIELHVKNIGNDEQHELGTDSFRVIDSQHKSYPAILYESMKFADATYTGTIQAGLGTDRGAFFLLPFDKNLEYTLYIQDRAVNLGKGDTFTIVNQ